MKKLRVGHAGCGSVSIRGILPHITQPDAQEHLELVAVCDVDGERARAVADQFGAERSYNSFEELIQSDDIDMVIIATPIFLHAAQAEMALRAGKHVYVNKSMALTLDEADRVMQAVKDTGLKLVSAPGQMLAPSLSKIRELVQKGDFGHMYWGFANNTGGGHGVEMYQSGNTSIRRDPTWYYKKPSGGPIYDMGVYSLHSVTGILGPVRRVTAMSGIVRNERRFDDQVIDVEMDDNTWMVLDFGHNCFVTVGAGLCHHGVHMYWGQLALYGSDGGVEISKLDDATGWPSELRILRGGSEELIQTPISEHPLLRGEHLTLPEPHIYVDIMHLVDCIRHERTPVASLEHARHVVEVIEKSYIAAHTGVAQQITSTF
ncbi:Gfo/Idh/MocA family protein [Paenibacillus montanisoli]|uniref:Gfo/Idh/MocA family oxidoreductase n=1 Tax=Paenibacillus montanisoli TaxID=2081970 RepID=A0A328U244_9BACL|nr:Gfo/Idh/MocA family oxidoreductase [Paenibacillus montanisoli]RAP75843.1 gfo/Idh/MocA family oxidoreductase [Paenibacillus montanisoli]